MRVFLIVLLSLLLPAASAGAAELSGTLKKIKESGAITLGHREASYPLSYLDEAGQPVGYSIDLCLRVVAAVKDKLGLDDHKPPDASEWRMLLDRISDTYAEAYRQRYQLERSLALSTRRSEGQPEDAGRLEALRHERDHYRMLVASKASCGVANAFSTGIKVIWPRSNFKSTKMSTNAFFAKSSRSQWVKQLLVQIRRG